MKTISQSLIREMLSERGYCGYYLNEVYNNGYSTPPTEAMENGLFFEQEVIGSTRDGKRIELPKSKVNGSKLKRETDLERTIAFARRIITENHIAFDAIQVHLTKGIMHGHLDALGTFNGVPYIFDLKWTGKTFEQWERDLKWGTQSADFILQARQYQAIADKPLPFMFLVFGDDWCRFFEVPYDEPSVLHHADVAAEALETFNAMDYRPTTDSRLCFDCRINHICEKRNYSITIETL